MAPAQHGNQPPDPLVAALESNARARFANSDEEAERRFRYYRARDPFPQIEPALLNAADIVDYVAATGMIFPFSVFEPLNRAESSAYPNTELHAKLKPASYELDLCGTCLYWDNAGKLREQVVAIGDEFCIPANSIVFVTLEPVLRVPDYIALRFNLKISHVYKGLLLGTGPLVDPGFVGRLSLPLHNLTASDYVFHGGEGLIWMEFTKISPWRDWNKGDEHARWGVYVPFPDTKQGLEPVKDYLHKAAPFKQVRSSIPDVVLQAQEEARRARDDAAQARSHAEEAGKQVSAVEQRVTRLGIAAIVGSLVAAAALVLTTYTVVQDAIAFVDGQAAQLREEINRLESIIEGMEKELQSGLINRSVHPPTSG